MPSDLLSIGSSGLYAAQAALATTSNNIANANTPGYNRQTVVQGTLPSQNIGVGFVGTGTQVSEVQRVYDSYLTNQVNAAQSNSSSLDAYTAQISQIDNLIADPTAGLSPTLQDFFSSVQDMSANPSSAASRQSMLSSASTMASNFQALSSQLSDINSGINQQITSTVSTVNALAQQIAGLNGQIAGLATNASNQPNDLLDQRDELVAQLNTYVKTTAVAGDNNSLTVTIGNGQPLVSGNTASELAAVPSTSNPDQMEIAFVSGVRTTVMPDSSITGGLLGGLMTFRSDTLSATQNQLGMVAAGLAVSFNNQNELGQDLNGNPGGPLFTLGTVTGTANTANSATGTTQITAAVSDPSKLTGSDYNVKFDGTNYVVTRESDGQQTTINPYPQATPQTIDGVDFSISGSAAAGDSFEVRPTANAAATINVAISDTALIAAGTPISTAAAVTNTGSATISAGSIDNTYLGNALAAPVTMTYTVNDPANPVTGGGVLNFNPAAADVTVTSNGTSTVYPAGTPVPYTDGAQLSFGGVNLSISNGPPGNNDTFTVGPNTSGVGDNRNAVLLAGIQTANVMSNGTATLQGAYAQMVSFVGNNARAAQVSGSAAATLLTTTTTAQQNVSGVNLDEEAANLLKYQQAYQASGKVIQIASTLFNTLLSLGGTN
jgi:flagellar hook-associated protein 1 FlgK